MISVISLLPPKQDVLINEKHKHSFFNRTNSFKVEGNKITGVSKNKPDVYVSCVVDGEMYKCRVIVKSK
jgi:hypothetical protein